MRSISIFTAPWYPGHTVLLDAIAAAEEKLQDKDVSLKVVDVSASLKTAEENYIVSIPTAILYRDDEERRRVTGAIGQVELLGLAGVRTRARKTHRR